MPVFWRKRTAGFFVKRDNNNHIVKATSIRITNMVRGWFFYFKISMMTLRRALQEAGHEKTFGKGNCSTKSVSDGNE